MGYLSSTGCLRQTTASNIFLPLYQLLQSLHVRQLLKGVRQSCMEFYWLLRELESIGNHLYRKFSDEWKKNERKRL